MEMYPGGSCGGGPAPGGGPGASSMGAVKFSNGLPLWNVCQMSLKYPSCPGVCPAPYTGFWISGTVGGPTGGGGGAAIGTSVVSTGWPGAGVHGPDGVGVEHGGAGSAAAWPANANAPPAIRTPATAARMTLAGEVTRA